ncbi:hypothetical protein Tco_0314658, partial [Tanacetum coccineum]
VMQGLVHCTTFASTVAKKLLLVSPHSNLTFFFGHRRCPILNGFNLGWIHMNSFTIDHMTEELYFRNLKFALGKLGIQLLLLK